MRTDEYRKKMKGTGTVQKSRIMENGAIGRKGSTKVLRSGGR